MSRKAISLIGLLFVIFYSCLSEPELKQTSKIDKIFSKQVSSTEYQNSDNFISIQPGQWIILRKYEGNEQVYLKYSAYNDDAGNPWIEIQDIRKNKEIIIQYQVSNLSASTIDGLGIKQGHYYMDERQMDHAAMMMTTYLIPLYSLGGSEKMNLTVTTPAGIFQHVYGKSGGTTMNYSFESENVSISIQDIQSGTMFFHPALPMNGIVGWKSTKDNAEVVDFGFDGAVPALTL